MPHAPPLFREPGTYALPYGLPLGVSIQAEFELDDFPDIRNMAVDGSVTSKFFAVTAGPSPVAFHTFMILVRSDTNQVFPETFGDLGPLPKGIQLAVRDPDRNILGTAPTTPVRDNADWYLLGPEYVNYDLGFGPHMGSIVAIQVRTQPSEDAIALLPGFSLGFLIQDDLSMLTEFRAVAFGRNLKPEIGRSP